MVAPGAIWGLEIGCDRKFGMDTISFAPAPEPVPATMLLLGSGLLGLAAFRRRFRKG